MALSISRGFDPAVFSESPWLWPYRAVVDGLSLADSWPSFATLEGLIAARAKEANVPALHLQLQAPKRKKKRRARGELLSIASLYDIRISEGNELSTRAENWHDFFNVLAFATWPRSKRALHARQARLLRARLPERIARLPGERTREQDVLTMFDEGGVVLGALASSLPVLSDPDVILDDVLPEFFAQKKVQIAPFGHALAEHIVAGLACPLAYASVVILPALDLGPIELVNALDAQLALQLDDPAQFLLPSGVKGLSLERVSARL